MDIIGTCDDGNYFYLSATSDSSRLTHEVWGHLHHANGFVYTIKKCNVDMEKLGENGAVPKHWALRFSANRCEYQATIHLMPDQFTNFTLRPWRHQSIIHPCQLTLNGRQGRVLFTSTNTFHGHCPLDVELSLPYVARPARPLTRSEEDQLVLFFGEEACRYESLVGGKGSSLALLSASCGRMPADCTVPQGFCLSVNAWKRQIDHSKDVLSQLQELKEAATNPNAIKGQLEESCRKASQALAAAPVDSFIRDCVREALHVNHRSTGILK